MTNDISKAVEQYARERMSKGELLTWGYDQYINRAVFYIPNDVDVETYPTQISGAEVQIFAIPRPVEMSKESRWRIDQANRWDPNNSSDAT